MEEERIVINGMKFKAERLIPNYAGLYTCKCEECIFDKDWVDFGDENPCRKVACIRNGWNEGNRNVWVVDGSIDDLKPKPMTWWVEYTYKYRWWDYDDRLWQEEKDCDAQRFFCREEEISERSGRLSMTKSVQRMRWTAMSGCFPLTSTTTISQRTMRYKTIMKYEYTTDKRRNGAVDTDDTTDGSPVPKVRGASRGMRGLRLQAHP